MPELHAIVLAAGPGSRMRCARPKPLHKLWGIDLLGLALRAAAGAGASSTTAVIGHKTELMRPALAAWPEVRIVVQQPLLGPIHALAHAVESLAKTRETRLVIPADLPLVRAATLKRLVDEHARSAAALTLATAVVSQPYGYTRVLRQDGRLARIVEERDAAPEHRRIREITSGVCAFAADPLQELLGTLDWREGERDRTLPDLVALFKKRGLYVHTVEVLHSGELLGVNSQTQLAEAGALMRQAKNEELMAAGVTLEDPATTYVGPDVEVGPDTVLHPNVFLEGRTRVGRACEIHSGARLVDSTVADHAVVLNHCVIEESEIGPHATIGPFAHFRPGTHIGPDAKIGNFVELKKTTFGRGSKANHLTYLGDATVGERVNIGAGTITCNYDGTTKHQTTIEDEAFIGSDSQLIAPVSVGRNAYVAAGSSITEDVPADALAVARSRQVNKEGWARERRKKMPKAQ
ncbi:MAG: UDP-N-acetylglucosamine diphosphorylase/glucosamine-1-phosphate N-acetyltransferase [Luteitalea sp.]|nr:UDP-N-acetylglucosamine diphosphorylase/glucosamine-1-phosphate N-acetyltransferase [Luteitalea sp.]